MIKLYNAAYIAMREGHVVYGAALIWAENIHEATGLAIEYVIEKHPDMFNHQVKMFEVDADVIQRAYEEQNKSVITIKLNREKS